MTIQPDEELHVIPNAGAPGTAGEGFRVIDRTDATDEEFRARVEVFDAAEAAPESFDAVAAVRRVEALAQSWEANNRHALRSGLTPSGRAIAQTALDAAELIHAALRGDRGE